MHFRRCIWRFCHDPPYSTTYSYFLAKRETGLKLHLFHHENANCRHRIYGDSSWGIQSVGRVSCLSGGRSAGRNIATVSSLSTACKAIHRRHGLDPSTERRSGLVTISQTRTLKRGFLCTGMIVRSHNSSAALQTRTRFLTTRETCYSTFGGFARITQVTFPFS